MPAAVPVGGEYGCSEKQGENNDEGQKCLGGAVVVEGFGAEDHAAEQVDGVGHGVDGVKPA